MAQASKIIDLTKTYIPGDPNAFPENIVYNAGEDKPESVNPILAYEGWNFLPTGYGVKSYFGLTGLLNVDPLLDDIDHLLLYQKKTLENFLIALGNEGIWIKDTDASGAWTHAITLDPAPSGEHLEWTWCVIGEDFYAYRQGGAFVYKISPTVVYWIPADPVPDLAAVVDTVDATGTIPAGTYTYYIAYKETTTGHISIPEEGIEVTVPTFGDTVDFTWTAPSGSVDEYVMYRKNSDGLYEYRELNISTLLFTDTGAGWTEEDFPIAASIQYAAYAVQSNTPNTLNMAGQLGIFRAGARLGFWDSENALSWSALDNKMDFAPSLKTLAATGQKFDDIIGKIVTIRSSKENFVIYSTKSIVLIQRAINEAFIWRSMPITNKAGVAYPREVCTGQVDTEHFAYTSMGLMRISEATYEIIVPNVIDFLREAKDPVYLDLIQNRYLFLSLISEDYIYGRISFTTELVLPLTVSFEDAVIELEDPQTPGCEKFNIITKIPDQVVVYKQNEEDWDTFDFTEDGYPVDVDVPVYAADTNYYGYVAGSLGSNSEANLDKVPIEGLKVDPDLSWISTASINLTVTGVGTFVGVTPLATDFTLASEYGSGTEQEHSFAYAGSIDSFFANQLQKFYGTIRFNNAFIDDILTRSGESLLTLSNVTTTPGTLDASIATYNGLTTINTASQNSLFALLPCDLGEVQIDSSTVDTIEYATVAIFQHFTKLRGVLLHCQIERLGSVQIDETHYDHNVRLTFSYKEVTVDIIPCESWDVNCSFHSVEAAIQTLIETSETALSVDLEEAGFRARIYIDSFIQYDLLGASTPSATAAPTPTYPAVCPTDEDATIFGTIFGGFNTSTGTICGNTPTTPGDVFDSNFSITAPATSFLLQQGSPAPLYPTFKGALVYDNQLKRWGKFRGDFKQLLDYAPINNISSGIVPYEVFGVEGAVLLGTGKVATFDEAPTDSYLKYGKIGYTRLGFTDGEEIIAHFRRGSTGTLGHVVSLDGRTEESSLENNTAFSNALSVTHYTNHPATGYGVSGKWFGITLTGLFDLQYLEFKGHRKGRR